MTPLLLLAAYHSGLAVSKDHQFLALSCASLNSVCVFSISLPECTLEVVRTFSGHGGERGQFMRPQGLCFTHAGTLMVCDVLNNRVQDFHLQHDRDDPLHVYDMNAVAWCVDSFDQQFVVGSSAGFVYLHAYPTGQRLREIQLEAALTEPIGACNCLRFTAAGDILAGHTGAGWLSLYTSTGRFRIHIGEGTLRAPAGPMGVAFEECGNLIVTDPKHHSVHVFSPDGDTLLSTWSSADARSLPSFAVLFGSVLLVLDRTGNLLLFD